MSVFYVGLVVLLRAHTTEALCASIVNRGEIAGNLGQIKPKPLKRWRAKNKKGDPQVAFLIFFVLVKYN